MLDLGGDDAPDDVDRLPHRRVRHRRVAGRRPVRRPAAAARRQQPRPGAAQRRRRRPAVRPVRPGQPVAVARCPPRRRPSRWPSSPPAGPAGPAPAPRRCSTASSSPPGWSCPPPSRRSSSATGSTASPARGSRPPHRAGTRTCSPGCEGPEPAGHDLRRAVPGARRRRGRRTAGRAADPAQRPGGLQHRRVRADRLTPAADLERWTPPVPAQDGADPTFRAGTDAPPGNGTCAPRAWPGCEPGWDDLPPHRKAAHPCGTLPPTTPSSPTPWRPS